MHWVGSGWRYAASAAVLLVTACSVGEVGGTSGASFGSGSPTPASASNGSSPTDTADSTPTTGISDGGSGGETVGDTTGDTPGSGGPSTDPNPTAESTATPGSSGTVEDAVCGDGVAQGDESCDGKDFRGDTCADFGFDDGTLICGEECNVLTDACRTCGDGTVSASELCDGDNLGGESCTTQGFGSGILTCDNCVGFDTSGCMPLPSCGDGVRNGAEQCDGADLGGASCQSLGYDAGSLSCNAASCTHNVNNCEFLNCGGQGDFCFFDPDDPQGSCCPAGVGGNNLGICVLAICQ